MLDTVIATCAHCGAACRVVQSATGGAMQVGCPTCGEPFWVQPPAATSAASQNIRSEYFESRTDTSQGTAPAPSGFRPSESAASTPPRRDASRPASARETQSCGSELSRQSTRGRDRLAVHAESPPDDTVDAIFSEDVAQAVHWFAAIGGRPVGPMSLLELRQNVNTLGVSTLVWQPGWPQWRAALDVEELRLSQSNVEAMHASDPGSSVSTSHVAPADGAWAFDFGGDESEKTRVVTSAPLLSNGPASTSFAGERKDDSVLFSLDLLAQRSARRSAEDGPADAVAKESDPEVFSREDESESWRRPPSAATLLAEMDQEAKNRHRRHVLLVGLVGVGLGIALAVAALYFTQVARSRRDQLKSSAAWDAGRGVSIDRDVSSSPSDLRPSADSAISRGETVVDGRAELGRPNPDLSVLAARDTGLVEQPSRRSRRRRRRRRAGARQYPVVSDEPTTTSAMAGPPPTQAQLRAAMREASLGVEACRVKFGEVGLITVEVTFSGLGRVTRCRALGGFAATRFGECVVSAVRSEAYLASYSGASVTFKYPYLPR